MQPTLWLDNLLRFFRRLIPRRLFHFLQPLYHYLLAVIGVLAYRWPGRQLKVILITGTKGKSSVSEMLNAIYEAAGHHTALANTIRHKTGNTSQPNKFKMTLPGRFFLQRFLRQAVTAGCQVAIIEMTSEGVKQFRHKFLSPDVLIFTNLSPEHIEAHGSFAAYREAKLAIADELEKSKKKNRLLIVNADDESSPLFIDRAPSVVVKKFSPSTASPVVTLLPGEVNQANWLAASAGAEAEGLSQRTISEAIKNLQNIPGRFEAVIAEPFKVIVDYAHTADSLTKVYETYKHQPKICVLGGTGGGRDKWKRPVMGSIAGVYCQKIILTNEDPYDEDPKAIVNDIARGIKKNNYQIIMDRRQAINSALQLANELVQTGNKSVVILITGKGTDPYIMGSRGTRTPWDDATVVREELKRM